MPCLPPANSSPDTPSDATPYLEKGQVLPDPFALPPASAFNWEHDDAVGRTPFLSLRFQRCCTSCDFMHSRLVGTLTRWAHLRRMVEMNYSRFVMLPVDERDPLTRYAVLLCTSVHDAAYHAQTFQHFEDHYWAMAAATGVAVDRRLHEVRLEYCASSPRFVFHTTDGGDYDYPWPSLETAAELKARRDELSRKRGPHFGRVLNRNDLAALRVRAQSKLGGEHADETSMID